MCGRYKVYTYTHASVTTGERDGGALRSVRAYRRFINARGHHNFASTPPHIRAHADKGERRSAGACVRAPAHTCGDSRICMPRNRPGPTPSKLPRKVLHLGMQKRAHPLALPRFTGRFSDPAIAPSRIPHKKTN